MSNQKLVDLGRRPVMIDLLIEAMPYLGAEEADLAKVYYQAVKRKMERDISLGRTFTSLADKIFFMCEISWEMISARQLKINYKQVPDRIREYFGARADGVQEDHWRHDLLSQTMLVRDDDGYYHPAHKSLIEFFSAYKLSAAIGALRDEYVEAARSRAGVQERLQPTGQPWSEYFGGAGGGKMLVPLERFVKESPAELEKTWGQLALDDATSEMILLLCGQEALCDYVKRQNSSDEIEGKVAARVLEVAAFSGDLRQAVLSEAHLSGCRLRNCDLSGADLSGSVWSGGSVESVKFEGASLRGIALGDATLTDVTLRRADLSNARLDADVSFRVNVAGAVWCTRGSEELLLVVMTDGRLVAVIPHEQRVQELSRPGMETGGMTGQELTSWLLRLSGDADLSELGRVFLKQNGWIRNGDWTTENLGGGLAAKFDQGWTGPGGDVEHLTIQVTDADTGGIVLYEKIYDASDLGDGRPGTRSLAISKDGKKIVTINGTEKAQESADIRGAQGGPLPLQGFYGNKFVRGPETVDRRGAAFSPSVSLLAVCERPNVVGFWLARSGEFVGRVVFHPAGRGCIVDGSAGLPPEFVTSNTGENDGWLFEPPS